MKTVIIAGGGTGGHIYPGVAIGRALEASYPDHQVHFAGSVGGLEETIIPKEGFPLHLIRVGKLHRSVGIWQQLKTALLLPLAFIQAWCLIRRLRPVAVLGVGGFASGPVLFVASLLRIRTVIWEPNAHPGLANRLLSRFVSECLVVFSEATVHLKAKRIVQAGLPVRATIRPHARADHGPLRVLVFGGSQGARAINNVVAESVVQGGTWLEGVELVHQTGRLDYDRIQRLYAQTPRPQVQVLEYLHDMQARYAWADLIVCRAGASTVAEIGAAQKAAVFVPLPTAADNHQQKNAEVLVRDRAAAMILQKELTPQSFQSLICDFRDHREKIQEFEKNVARFQFPNAAEKIIDRLLPQ